MNGESVPVTVNESPSCPQRPSNIAVCSRLGSNGPTSTCNRVLVLTPLRPKIMAGVTYLIARWQLHSRIRQRLAQTIA
jgi:hypothetical protein